jgi:hypothetical protein
MRAWLWSRRAGFGHDASRLLCPLAVAPNCNVGYGLRWRAAPMAYFARARHSKATSTNSRFRDFI